MRTASLTSAALVSGWGQPHDALSSLAPEALAIAYAHLPDARGALAAIATQARGKEIAIGWSLGGQLLVRATAAGMVRPKLLVLIATPFQFVASPSLKLGMPADLYEKFRSNYAANPGRTLQMAWESIVRGDERHAEVRKHLDVQHKQALIDTDWLHWLDTLEQFSCSGLYLSDFPPTLLIHGDKDAVVFSEQSRRFAAQIPHASLTTLKGCGHAPHWHDPSLVQAVISEAYARV